MTVLYSAVAAGILMTLLALAGWCLAEFRYLRSEIERLRESIKELQDFKWETRSAFTKVGLKWIPPQQAKPGEWEKL